VVAGASWWLPLSVSAADTASYDERINALVKQDNYLGQLSSANVNCWPPSSIPIKVFIHPAQDVPAYKPIYSDFLKAALTKWTEASNGKLKFAIVDKSAEDGMDIIWKPRYDESNGSGGEGGRATAQPGSNGIQSATIELYTYPNEHTIPDQIMDVIISIACLHETGHALGIAGHSQTAGDIMSAIGALKSSDTADNVKLTERDRNTILAILEVGPRSTNFGYTSTPGSSAAFKPDSGAVLADLINSAVVDIHQGKCEAAVSKLEKSLELDPNNAAAVTDMRAAYLHWAELLGEKHQFDRSAEMYAKALSYFDRQPKPDKSYVIEIMQCYLDALEQAGNDSEAKIVQAQLDALSK
jgi:predicted Zn-dependent protease